LVARGLTLCGVTTDGSALYPEPLRIWSRITSRIA
jgi:hypothetical protein